MAVHVTVAPPDGFESWDEGQWDEWLDDHPWEPAEQLAERGDWLVFLYQARVHAKRTAEDLAPFLERLITEHPVPSTEIAALHLALQNLAAEFGRSPASRLWTGTQFYTAEYLHALIVKSEAQSGHRGAELTIRDLWQAIFTRLAAVLQRALADGRGIYFGHLDESVLVGNS